MFSEIENKRRESRASEAERELEQSYRKAIEQCNDKKYTDFEKFLSETEQKYGLYVTRTYLRRFIFNCGHDFMNLNMADEARVIVFKYLNGQVYPNTSYGEQYIEKLLDRYSHKREIIENIFPYNFWVISCDGVAHSRNEKCNTCDQIYLRHDFVGFRKFLEGNGQTDLLAELDQWEKLNESQRKRDECYGNYGGHKDKLLFFSHEFLLSHSKYFYENNTPPTLSLADAISKFSNQFNPVIWSLTYVSYSNELTLKNILYYIKMGVDPYTPYTYSQRNGFFSVAGYLIFILDTDEWLQDSCEFDSIKLIAESVVMAKVNVVKDIVESCEIKIDKTFGMALLNILLSYGLVARSPDSIIATLKYLVEECGVPVHNELKEIPKQKHFFAGTVIDDSYYTSEPILMACRSASGLQAIEYLVSKGADIKMVDEGCSNLYTLCVYNYFRLRVNQGLNYMHYTLPRLFEYFHGKGFDMFQVFYPQIGKDESYSTLEMMVRIMEQDINEYTNSYDKKMQEKSEKYKEMYVKFITDIFEKEKPSEKIMLKTYSACERHRYNYKKAYIIEIIEKNLPCWIVEAASC